MNRKPKIRISNVEKASKKNMISKTVDFRIIFEILKYFRKKIFFPNLKFYFRNKISISNLELLFRILKSIFECLKLKFKTLWCSIRTFIILRRRIQKYVSENLKTLIFLLKILTFKSPLFISLKVSRSHKIKQKSLK